MPSMKVTVSGAMRARDVSRPQPHHEATAEEDAGLRRVLAGIFVAERADAGVPVPEPAHHLFGFGVDRCLLTRTTGHGDAAPQHTTWQARGG